MRPKPVKPVKDFPLFPHASGKWAKKINGKTRYFGHWDDPDGALKEFRAWERKDAEDRSSAATGVPAKRVRLTIETACHLFLDSREDAVKSNSNRMRTYQDYIRTCKRFADFMVRATPIENITPSDFRAYKAFREKTCNVVSVGNEVTRIKTMLKWLEQSKLTGKIEVGPDFRKPSRLVTRRHRREIGKKLYSAREVQMILDESGVQMRAMILLGINCGYQNSDIESLSLEVAKNAVATGWIDFARIKTEVERRCPLWPQTLEALQLVIDRRSRLEPVDGNEGIAFLLPHGKAYSATNCDVAKRFRSARDNAMISSGGFSWLRKTFATIASNSKDQVAVNFIMGHVDSSMSAVYRQEVWDERLEAVTSVVGDWLWVGL